MRRGDTSDTQPSAKNPVPAADLPLSPRTEAVGLELRQLLCAAESLTPCQPGSGPASQSRDPRAGGRRRCQALTPRTQAGRGRGKARLFPLTAR